MVRWLRVGPALVLLAVLGVVQAQDATILYKDRVAKKNGVDIVGTIEEETFLGVKIKSAKTKETKFIPAADIERITYTKSATDVGKIEYRVPFGKEDKANEATANIANLKDPLGKHEKDRIRLESVREGHLTDALTGYAKLEKEVKEPAAKRYFQFKHAQIVALQAKYDPARTDEAVKALTEFKTANREGWQLLVALETLAKIQEEAGKTEDARKTYEELAELPGAPDSVKQQSGVFVGKLFLRGKQYKEAEERLKKVVESMSAGDLQRPLAQAYLIESQLGQDKTATAEKDIAALIGGTSDARVRGVAYALMGDFHAKKGRQAEAFWSYLRVDALYNEDAEAHARALYNLSTLFDKVKKDPLRGKACLEQLLDKRFEGSPYQKLAQAATKKE